MITLGYGEIKGDTFPDDVDQGKMSVFTVMYLALLERALTLLNVFFMYLLPVFGLYLHFRLLSGGHYRLFINFWYFAGYGYTGQYNPPKPELPPHYSQFN